MANLEPGWRERYLSRDGPGDRIPVRDNRKFIVLDLMAAADLPDHLDLTFCRDVIGHFTPREGAEMLRKITRSTRYLMATTFPGQQANDHAERSWYPCNLQKPPFNLPDPIYLFCEHSAGDKSLGSWRCAGELSARGD